MGLWDGIYLIYVLRLILVASTLSILRFARVSGFGNVFLSIFSSLFIIFSFYDGRLEFVARVIRVFSIWFTFRLRLLFYYPYHSDMYSFVVALPCVDQLVATSTGVRNPVDFTCMNMLQCYVGLLISMYTGRLALDQVSRQGNIGSRLTGRCWLGSVRWCVARGTSEG
jgi:hypothetical protein